MFAQTRCLVFWSQVYIQLSFNFHGSCNDSYNFKQLCDIMFCNHHISGIFVGKIVSMWCFAPSEKNVKCSYTQSSVVCKVCSYFGNSTDTYCFFLLQPQTACTCPYWMSEQPLRPSGRRWHIVHLRETHAICFWFLHFAVNLPVNLGVFGDELCSRCGRQTGAGMSVRTTYVTGWEETEKGFQKPK